MKLVVFSDLHAHPLQFGAKVLENGRNSRLQDALDAMAAVRRTAKEQRTRAVLFCGDLFHTMDRVLVPALDGVYEEIQRFGEDGLVLFLLVGNHDQAGKTGQHALEVFKSLDHVVVMDRPGWYAHACLPETSIFGIPYLEDTNQLRATLAGVDAATRRSRHAVLALHAGFAGAKVGPQEYRMGSELAVGDVPDGFDLVFAGHYHMPQWLSEERRILYVGATLAHNWGDVNQARGYLVADLARRTIERIESAAPRFLRVTPGELGRVRPGDFVEVVLPHDAERTADEAIQEALAQANVGAAQIAREPGPEAPLRRLGPSAPTDVEALIGPYVDHVAGGRGDEERRILTDLGRELLRRAGR